ncbi:MAG: hypothetical protein ACXABY_20280 [Candidatus Thorarchaeota archaeon]|jgi:hypothetical protein
MPTKIIPGWHPFGIETDPANPLDVEVQGISIINFNTSATVSNVADNTKTTILTQAYVAGSFENLVIVSVSGEDYAKFFLTVNGSDIDIRRTGPDRNLTFDFTGAPFALTTGDVVDVKVEHFNVGSLVDFEATVYGYN